MNLQTPTDLSRSESAMDGSTFNSVPGDDVWLEQLLLQDAADQTHIDDAGFSDRVIRALPLPSKSVSRWLVPSMAVLGGVMAMGLTPAGGYFANNFLSLFDIHHLSLAHLWVLVPIAVMYVCSFTAVRQP